MSELKNKYLLIEVTKSPPSASLCGPARIVSRIENSIDNPRDVRLDASEMGDVMEIRLTGVEGKHTTTLFKMALLYGALKAEYEPVASQSSNDSLILTRSNDAR